MPLRAVRHRAVVLPRIDSGDSAPTADVRGAAAGEVDAALQKESKEALEKLAQHEAQLQKLLADLEEERSKREAAEKRRRAHETELAELQGRGPEGRQPSSISTRRRRATG